MSKKQAFSFLAIGETVARSEFKRYVGLGESYPIALNPTKKELEAIYGRELNYEPTYFGTNDEDGKRWARLDFLLKTKPESCNGVEILTTASFTIRDEKYYNSDKTKVRVIDLFGNSVWMLEADAEAHKTMLDKKGNPVKLGKYRIARKGEPELCDFLRKFINVPDAFDYAEGLWTPKKLKHVSELTKEEAEKGDILTYEQCSVALDKDDFDNFFKGDASSLWTVIKSRMQANKSLGIKMLYGVKIKDDNKPVQTVCTGYDMMLHRNAKSTALERLEKNLISAKNSRMYSNIDYRIQELQEYTVQPTDLSAAPASSSEDELPFPTSVDNLWDN